ncbi:MAG: PhoD-like phosphatase N-terminal domain-containing protein, partial [Caulobacterales bacterium]|nr:PhoD-like phosphatase N-terminal domain-containing protein [Caulobacterales bacterium]
MKQWVEAPARGREDEMGPLTRRAMLARGGLAAAAGGALAACSPRETFTPATTGRFRHGVASGDPLSDRVMVWTRATPDDASGPALLGRDG